MNFKISAILTTLLILLPGCNATSLTCDYAERLRKSQGLELPDGVVEVQVKIKKGLAKPDSPRSVTTPFSVECEIIKGKIPKHSGVKNIHLRLYHDWTDVLVKDNAVLTLRFAENGQLFDIKEFVVTSLG